MWLIVAQCQSVIVRPNFEATLMKVSVVDFNPMAILNIRKLLEMGRHHSLSLYCYEILKS